jgi:hypothetical protein
VAQWLVVLLTSVVLLDSSAATVSVRAQKQTCSSCVRCECCVKEAPAESTPPLAPVSSNRALLQKDFQWLLTVSALLDLPIEAHSDSSISSLAVPIPAAAPLYQRHCAYLI